MPHPRLPLLLAAAAAPAAGAGTCHFSYATQHSYSRANLSGLGVTIGDTWYVNGDGTGMGGGALGSLDVFLAKSEAEYRAGLLNYVATGRGQGIAGGLDTTNAIVLDIEAPANLKLLGTWLDAERTAGNGTFMKMVDAVRMRIAVAREIFPHAQIGIYGTPNGPWSYPGENFTQSSEGYVEAGRRGIFDNASFLVPVLYFGANESSSQHERNVYWYSNVTMALAASITRSDGSPLPIFANTKFTYHAGPLAPPYAGWVEKDTTDRLVAAWRAQPRVERIMWWFYPDDSLEHYQQPPVSAIEQWFRSVDPVPADCPRARG